MSKPADLSSPSGARVSLIDLPMARGARPATEAFLCAEGDSLWRAIELALDNGYGLVFVANSTGAVVGHVTMADLRDALRSGRHLGHIVVGDVVRPGLPIGDVAVRAVLDAAGRLADIEARPEAEFLPVAEPDLTHRELRNVMDAVLSTWISSRGDYLTEFERRFSTLCGTRHGISTANGTVSLHLALVALGIGPGDEVIVPDFTFAASANAVCLTGARPVLIDVDPNTWCMTVEAFERAITPATRAVMPVHVFGRPAPMTEIRELARARGIFVLEDCAEAHGARYAGRPVGSFSDVASFSFFANKIMTTGEGGICLTDDDALAARMRTLRDHAMRPERRYWHEEVGFNYRMTNMQAAVGCGQLDRFDDLLAMRRRLNDLYVAALSEIPGLSFASEMEAAAEPVIWFSCVRVPADKRAGLIDLARRANIDIRPFFNSLSAMPAYRPYAAECPVSADLAATGINLPMSRKIDADLVGRIADIVRAALR